MNTIKSKVLSEEDPKECHDHSFSSKAYSNMESELNSKKKESEKSSSKNWISMQREEREFVVFMEFIFVFCVFNKVVFIILLS